MTARGTFTRSRSGADVRKASWSHNGAADQGQGVGEGGRACDTRRPAGATGPPRRVRCAAASPSRTAPAGPASCAGSPGRTTGAASRGRGAARLLEGDLHLPALDKPAQDLLGARRRVGAEQSLRGERAQGIADQHPAQGHGRQAAVVPDRRVGGDLDVRVPRPIPVRRRDAAQAVPGRRRPPPASAGARPSGGVDPSVRPPGGAGS